MKRVAKVWLTIAIFLTVIGIIIFGGVMTMLKWDFTKLSTSKYETNNHEIAESFSNILITTNTATIDFIPSQDSKCFVKCYEQENMKHSVAVKEGTLIIEINDTRKWYEYIGINFKTPKIAVHIPCNEYGALSIKSATGNIEIPKDLTFENITVSQSTGNVTNYASASKSIKIKTTTGNIYVENVAASDIDFSASTGKITASKINCDGDILVQVTTGKSTLTDVTCKNLISDGSTGNINLKNVVAWKKFFINRSTGNVKFDASDAAEIFVTTDTGKVYGSLLTDKVFVVKTDTGKIDVPNTVTGGKCEITTDTGDIKITVNTNS